MGDTLRNNSLGNYELHKGRFYPKAKAYYFKEWNDFSMVFHSHNAVEIMYVISGECLVETKSKSIEMRKGEFILLDANSEHRLQVEKDKPCRMLNVEFGFCEENTCLPSIGEIAKSSEAFQQLIQSGISHTVLRDSEEIYITLKGLIMELDRDDSTGNLLVQNLFIQLLLRISRLYGEAVSQNAGPGVIYVKKAVQYMHQHYDRDIQTRDIAAAVSINSAYLHRIFKSNKGCTINDYLTRIRMDKAKSLLSNTDIAITDISAYVGINSRQYFAFAFKKYTGMSPTAYRKSSIKLVYKY